MSGLETCCTPLYSWSKVLTLSYKQRETRVQHPGAMPVEEKDTLMVGGRV